MFLKLSTTAGGIDINSTTGFTLDATTISIDSTDDSNITVTNSGKDLTLPVAGGGTQVLSVNSAGTGTNAIDINATAGGIDIDASGVLALDGASGIDIGKTSDVAIDIDVSTLDIDTSSGFTLDATTISIDGTDNSNITVTGSGKNLTLMVLLVEALKYYQ